MRHPTLTLKHFILKQRALNLYRQVIRASRSIEDKQARRETIGWIRGEFERNGHLTDLTSIEERLAVGRRELKQILPTLGMRPS